ncbi:MAG TPA: aminopeptidase P N-terminal domain-containing protein [Mucilaginibacter sp.]|jgi:Xaa-Pro aminopeptidase|nr:aminopeptidase P N-terminal domain-containing protein [Mucilaginibacter sp.]
MKVLTKTLLFALLICFVSLQGFSQTAATDDGLPKDYLTKEFHAGRRDALRALMPANSVAVVFAYPERVFSNDVTYAYHPSPDLYYFSGYRETSAVLLIFKEMQHGSDGDYNELFFVNHRDPQQEQWTGKRLGVEGVKGKLGFAKVFNSEDFANYDVDLKKYTVIYDKLPGDQGNMKPLYDAFKAKTGVPDVDADLLQAMGIVDKYGNAKNISAILSYLKPQLDKPAFKNSEIMQAFVSKPDSVSLVTFKAKYKEQYSGMSDYLDFTTLLRGVKTAEEIDLMRKTVKISCLAHAEVMRAINPKMSETEIEGIFMYVHKHYGAEDEGYPPIVGSGANTCILHYEENNVTQVKNQLVLMDVGAEYHGYSADVTRTVPANGKFTEEQKAIYQIVYDAQEEVFKLCKEGVPYADLEKKTHEVLTAGLIKLGIIKDEKELGKYYPHGVSHHLGLDVHDKGEYGGPLKENMVITVEPGIYIPEGSPCDKKYWNIGVRIEDDVQIGKDHGTLLSIDAPRKWDDVEKMAADKSFFDLEHLPELK